MTGAGRLSWLDTSPADYDARLTAPGHKRDSEDQAALFYVPTPTRARNGGQPAQMDGQGDLFSGDDQP